MERSARILLVDDEPAVVQLLTVALQGQGWVVDGATTGEQALQLFRTEPYDLLLVDKNLPDLPGIEVIRQIRAHNSVTRFILITGYASVDSAIESANLGIHAYIEKPFDDVRKLAALVKRALDAEATAEAQGISQEYARAGRKRAAAAVPTAAPASPSQGTRKRVAIPQPRIRVLIAGSDVAARKAIAAQVIRDSFSASQYRTMDLGDNEQMRAALRDAASHDAIILHGEDGVLARVQLVREIAVRANIIVAAERLDLDTAKQLIELQVRAVIEDEVTSPGFHQRIDKILRTLLALKGALGGPAPSTATA
jgi:CheY-like chemotaxis protein